MASQLHNNADLGQAQTAPVNETLSLVTPLSISEEEIKEIEDLERRLGLLDNAGPDTVDQPRPARYPFLAAAEQPAELGRLGDYRVLKLLGAGGMGLVFLAEDSKLKRLVALKVLKPDATEHEQAVPRFLHEAQTMAKLDHDNIVTVYQVGEAGGVPYFTMQFLRGETLDHRLRHGAPLTIAQVLRFSREMAQGLAAAHAQGLIHRDIKPANIWLEAGSDRIKLLDFGLARGGEKDLNLTGKGTILGTPEYMAPEQANGSSVDGRTDLFSLGCVLYQMATRQSPFKRKDLLSTLRALELDHPKDPAQLSPEIPDPLARLIMRLLEKDPAKRPVSAQEVGQTIQAIENQAAPVLAVNEKSGSTQSAAQVQATTHESRRASSSQSSTLYAAEYGTARSGKSSWRRVWVIAGAALVFLGCLGLIWHQVVSRNAAEPVLDDWIGEPGKRNDFDLKVNMVGARSAKNGIHQFLAGDPISFRIEVDRDAYVGVWTVNLDGDVVQLFPNKHETDNFFMKGKPREIPGNSKEDYSIIAQVDKGMDCLRVVASSTPWKKLRGTSQGEFIVFSKEEEKRSLRTLRGAAVVEGAAPEPHELSEVILKYEVRPKNADRPKK